MSTRDRCACGSLKERSAKRCLTCSKAWHHVPGQQTARTIKLTTKGWLSAGLNDDHVLFRAPCVRCHVTVQRRLSGAYDSEGRHACLLVAAA